MFKESGVLDKVSLTADEKPLENHMEPHTVTDTCLVSLRQTICKMPRFALTLPSLYQHNTVKSETAMGRFPG